MKVQWGMRFFFGLARQSFCNHWGDIYIYLLLSKIIVNVWCKKVHTIDNTKVEQKIFQMNPAKPSAV